MAVTATAALFQSALPNLILLMAQFASKVDFWIPALNDSSQHKAHNLDQSS
jgi:hypothetical protein